MGREGEPHTPQVVQGAYVAVTVVGTELDRLRVCLAMLVISLLLSHSRIFDPEGTCGPSVQTGSSVLLLQDLPCLQHGHKLNKGQYPHVAPQPPPAKSNSLF